MEAGLLQAIRSAKLKKATKTADRSAPMVRAGLEKADIEQYYQNVQDTYVEEWEPLLTNAGLTFKTDYVPLEKKEAEALVEAYKCFEKLSEDQKNSPKYDRFYQEVASKPVFARMAEKLQDRIQKAMRKFGCKKVFVKCSSRSAKDAVNELPNMRSDFKDRCRRAKVKGGICSMNSAVIALLGAGKDAMSGVSAEYFLKLFVRSERIYQDMTLALDMSKFKSGWAIREWVDVDIGMEFRGFVYERKLCALCQYDYLVRIDKLQDRKTQQSIVERLNEFYQDKVSAALHGKMSDERNVESGIEYVDLSCWIIELNPFQESTDSAMFSWAQEKDLLTKEPLVFRFQDTEQKACIALSRKWRKLCESVLKEVNTESV